MLLLALLLWLFCVAGVRQDICRSRCHIISLVFIFLNIAPGVSFCHFCCIFFSVFHFFSTYFLRSFFFVEWDKKNVAMFIFLLGLYTSWQLLLFYALVWVVPSLSCSLSLSLSLSGCVCATFQCHSVCSPGSTSIGKTRHRNRIRFFRLNFLHF